MYPEALEVYEFVIHIDKHYVISLNLTKYAMGKLTTFAYINHTKVSTIIKYLLFVLNKEVDK